MPGPPKKTDENSASSLEGLDVNSLGCPHPSLLLPSSPASTTCFIFFHSIFKDTSIGDSMDVLSFFGEKKPWLTPEACHISYTSKHHFMCHRPLETDLQLPNSSSCPASRDLRTSPFGRFGMLQPSFCYITTPMRGKLPPGSKVGLVASLRYMRSRFLTGGFSHPS